MKKSNIKRYMQFALIVLAAGAIYPVMYLKTNYQETLLEVFQMSLPQLNVIYSVLGFVFMIGYFPSGVLSDKFSAKKLLTVSLLGTAAGGFWFAQIPSYTNVLIIYGIWGVFAVFTFWGAHMKLVKMLAEKEEEGRFFGILDGGRGVVEAVLASIAVVIFAQFLGGGTDIADKKSAMIAIIYMYSIVMLVVGILVGIFVKEDKKTQETENQKPEKFKFSDLEALFKNKAIFVMAGIIFMSYVVTWTIYYLGGFLETNVGVKPVVVGSVMVAVLWMRPIGGILGGFFADKIGKSKTLLMSILLAVIGLIVISVLPVSTGKTFFSGMIIIVGLFTYAIRGTYWSLLGDCDIEDKITGTAIGFASLLGYLPDIILPIFNSFLFAQFGGNGGYNAYFISSAIMGGIGILLILCFMKITKGRQEKA